MSKRVSPHLKRILTWYRWVYDKSLFLHFNNMLDQKQMNRIKKYAELVVQNELKKGK